MQMEVWEQGRRCTWGDEVLGALGTSFLNAYFPSSRPAEQVWEQI